MGFEENSKGRSARRRKQGRHGRRRAHCSSWGLQGKSGCEELRCREREPSRGVAPRGGDSRAAGRHGDRLLLCLLGLQAVGGVENQQGAARLGNRSAMLKKGKVQGELDHGEVLRGGGTPWTGARRPWEVPAHKPEGGAPKRAWSCCWAPARRSFCAASKAGEVELAPMEGEGQGGAGCPARDGEETSRELRGEP
jgi:hypothetical protein